MRAGCLRGQAEISQKVLHSTDLESGEWRMLYAELYAQQRLNELEAERSAQAQRVAEHWRVDREHPRRSANGKPDRSKPDRSKPDHSKRRAPSAARTTNMSGWA